MERTNNPKMSPNWGGTKDPEHRLTSCVQCAAQYFGWSTSFVQCKQNKYPREVFVVVLQHHPSVKRASETDLPGCVTAAGDDLLTDLNVGTCGFYFIKRAGYHVTHHPKSQVSRNCF